MVSGGIPSAVISRHCPQAMRGRQVSGVDEGDSCVKLRSVRVPTAVVGGTVGQKNFATCHVRSKLLTDVPDRVSLPHDGGKEAQAPSCPPAPTN